MKLGVTLSSILLLSILLNGCSTRQLQESLTGSTAQRLLTHSIDDIVQKLPEEKFEAFRDQKLSVTTYFIETPEIKNYVDERLKLELETRFGIEVADENESTENQLSVFYTSLATDQDNFGLTIPLGGLPGFNEGTEINIISLEKFHGVAELYFYLGTTGDLNRGETIQAVVKTDALGLPFITIPLSNVDRAD